MKSFVIAAAALCAAASVAQAADPVRISGTIKAVEGTTLTIADRDGKTDTVKLAPNYTVAVVKKASLADVKTGDLVGATTVPGKGGALIAIRLQIFPPGRRIREGSRPDSAAPHAMMTNAPITGDVQSADGRKLTLTYKGGEKAILVTKSTAIVDNAEGERSDMKPGEAVVLNAATKDADGSYATDRVTVGQGGVSP